MPSLQDLIAASPRVGARPESVVSLMEIIDDPVVEVAKLLPIVEKDPVLTAGLLKLCNSPIYNFKRRIGSPREALVLVGNLTFARMCFTLSMRPVLERDLPGYQLGLDELWRHCLGTAYGAAFLVKASGHPELRDRAFTAGLLHDIGKLVLDTDLQTVVCEPVLVGTGGSARVRTQNRLRITSDIERRQTGFDHAEAGAALLEGWNFPEDLVDAVRWHHDPTEADHQRLARAVHIADQVVRFSTKLRSSSRMLELWVERRFQDSAYPLASIVELAETLALKHRNILTLATAPRF